MARAPSSLAFAAWLCDLRPRLPPGAARSAFCTVTSLLPGTLPSGTDDSGHLMIHCLDKSQPVADQLAAEEALLMKALGYGSGND